METQTMEEQCRREVLELHRFFQDWFNAARPDEDASFARFEKVLAADFEIIGPGGELVNRDTVLQAVRGGHGRDPERKFRIEIRNMESRTVADGVVLVTYEEHQADATGTRAWLSSAVFRMRAEMPNGVEWVHVQETFLPAPAAPAEP